MFKFLLAVVVLALLTVALVAGVRSVVAMQDAGNARTATYTDVLSVPTR